MYSHRKHNVAAARFAERRRREDESPRLATEIPQLLALRLEIDERSGDAIIEPAHIRRVVLEYAPALFLIPCGDSRCTDGGHDVTREILVSLRSQQKEFETSDSCSGNTGSSPCTRVLHIRGFAEYRS